MYGKDEYIRTCLKAHGRKRSGGTLCKENAMVDPLNGGEVLILMLQETRKALSWHVGIWLWL